MFQIIIFFSYLAVHYKLCLTISPSVAGPHPDSLFTVHSVLRAPKGVHHLRRGGEAGVPGNNIGEC